ncbi:C39 family peptidase [Virgibacillus sp. MG-45]|uniref:C39 family peptidase n=1 Tax=Virgibacillus sp. MG-45 TaxID=3102791 RepID=UPI002EDA8C84
MNFILLSICIILAILFFYISSKPKVAWVRNSFVIYGSIFLLTALAIPSLFLVEHKDAIKQIIEESIAVTKNNQYTPEEMKISKHTIQNGIKIDAPKDQQLPELPRGCEVTSLSMLLKHHNIQVDKLELAEKVTKDPTPYTTKNGEIYFGNPYNGFVGDMYSFSKPGMGVYHKPIADLAKQYVGNRVLDFTGKDFNEVIDQLNYQRPVWVIINATYNKLPKSQFTTWNTKDGKINITMKQHSVLITGYDEKYIYFNDPLNYVDKAPIEEFKAAWVQMGKQAITITD